ncbi:hypothetical protein BYT27DRAFT_6726000 [Phlegmacium glaucopus]|nr:hypothetical protein BYT27DRAFT_6726000 [Phlegmacium glaucopus]
MRRPRLSYTDFEELEPSEDSDLDDIFFTPNTSPRTSMASSLLMFPTGRKPSRKSLRLSDASDVVISPTPTPASSTSRPMPVPPATTATRTPSAVHHVSAHNQRTPHAASLETHSVPSDKSVGGATPRQSELGRKAKEGTRHTRHGSVTLKPSDVVVPSTTTQSQYVKSTTTSKRKSGQQGFTDGDLTKDAKRPVPPSASPPPTVSIPSMPNGSAMKVTVTPIASASRTTAPTTIGSPSRKLSKPQPHANPDKTKEDVVVETETPKKGKELDTSTPSSLKSRMKDKGKEKEKATSTSAPVTHHGTGDDNVVVSERLGGSGGIINISPKTTYTSPKPHTFSAFAPLPTNASSSTTPSARPKTLNDNNKSSLPPAGFSFPPPPPHSPNQQPPQQQKNTLNGSAAAYTYAHRQKSTAASGGGSIMMNMAALLEEDEDGDEGTPARRLRHTSNGHANVQGREKGKKKKSFDSTSSRSDSSHHSYSGSPLRSTVNSNSRPTSNSNMTVSQPQSHSENSTFRNPPKTLTSEVNAMSLSTPGDRPSKGTQGYSSLVLPRAPPPLGSHSSRTTTIGSNSGSGPAGKWFGSMGGSKEGKIDLTRSGVAQTTMASVEVVRGLGRQQGQNGFGGRLLGMFGRKRSLSSGRGDAGPKPIEGLGKPVDGTKTVNEDLPSKEKAPTAAGMEGTVLGFTSYRKPPGYVPSSSVLVQVWAVGVDGVDGRLVGVRFGEQAWSTEGEREGPAGYEEVETEWERDVEGNEVDVGGNEVDVSKSTPQQNSNNKGLAGIGRSFSLRMSRTIQRGSVGVNAKQQQDQQQARGRPQSTQQQPSRAFSLKRNNTDQPAQQNTSTKTPQRRKNVLEKKRKRSITHKAEVGYIPGRSFVGRVLECGWDVRDEVIRKGEWVVGLLDVKKCGALTEFIVVDRHRIHRVPHPRKVPPQGNDHSNKIVEASLPSDDSNMSALTLEELALLPLCGVPAYRAVRTFIYAFSSLREGSLGSPVIGGANDRKEFGSTRSSKLTTEHPQDRRRRVLVLRGHDGVGAMAVQMLAQRGWKVSVHVPFSSSSAQPTTTATVADHHFFPRDIQERAKDWGADELIFDEEVGDGIDDGRIAAIRVIESLREDGDVFDAILDTVGGKEVREAGERLLRSAGVLPAIPGAGGSGFVGNEPMSPKTPNKAKGVGQFTTLIGDVPERPVPTAGDNFRAGLRSLRNDGSGGAGGTTGNGVNGDEGSAADMKGNKVGYAWVSVAQDVDWEGEDVGNTLASVLRLALEHGVRPVIGGDAANHRVVPFEKAPYVFVDKGPLGHGRNVVVKIAG